MLTHLLVGKEDALNSFTRGKQVGHVPWENPLKGKGSPNQKVRETKMLAKSKWCF